MPHKSYILFLGEEINLNHKSILEEIEIILCLSITSLIFHFSLSHFSLLLSDIKKKKKAERVTG